MYVGKPDGKIPQKFFDRKSGEWCSEQAEILRKIEMHQNASQSYLTEGVRLIELAQKAVSLYENQDVKEKRRILDFVFSNSTWKYGRLFPNYRKPFNLLAVTNSTYQKEKTALDIKDGLFEI